jgi:hypothetical protein
MLPLYPEERECEAPTATRVFEVFQAFQLHELSERGTAAKTFYPELTKLHKTIIKLLRIPVSAFRGKLS